MRNLTANFGSLIWQLTVKIFRFWRLTVNFWPIWRLTVNPIETLKNRSYDFRNVAKQPSLRVSTVHLFIKPFAEIVGNGISETLNFKDTSSLRRSQFPRCAYSYKISRYAPETLKENRRSCHEICCCKKKKLVDKEINSTMLFPLHSFWKEGWYFHICSTFLSVIKSVLHGAFNWLN